VSQISNYSAISWREQVNFQRDDEKFAFYMVDQLQFKLTPGQTLFDISKGSDRYVLYKVGPVISVSVSMYEVWFLVFNATFNNISAILWVSQISNYSAISWREQVNFQRDDDEVCFVLVLDQHGKILLGFFLHCSV
jgi:hypothetical protein